MSAIYRRWDIRCRENLAIYGAIRPGDFRNLIVGKRKRWYARSSAHLVHSGVRICQLSLNTRVMSCLSTDIEPFFGLSGSTETTGTGCLSQATTYAQK